MELKILSPERSQFLEALWVELNTRAGNFIVQEGHKPMIVSLAPNQPLAYCLTNGKQETFTPLSGVVEITRSSVTILLTQVPGE